MPSSGALYQFIDKELVPGLWDQRIGVNWIGPEKGEGFIRPELYSYDAKGRQVGKAIDVEFFSTDQIEKLLIGKGFNRRGDTKQRQKEEL